MPQSLYSCNTPFIFALKKGLDVGYVPTKCKGEYSYRSLALCYIPCVKDKETFVAGVCWENCAGSETDIGAICCTESCWKVWKWRAKKSYIAKSLTNFSKETVECDKPEEEYLAGALCYRDCKKVNLLNCGIGACAVDGLACLGGIMDMSVDIISGVAQLVAFIATLGASGGGTTFFQTLKNKVKSKISSFINGGFKGAFEHAKKYVLDKKDDFLKNAKSIFAKQFALQNFDTLCMKIGEQVVKSFKEKQMDTADKMENWVKMIDPTGIAAVGFDCAKAGKGDTEADKTCAKSVLNVIALIDPTGLFTIASAFLQPVCAAI